MKKYSIASITLACIGIGLVIWFQTIVADVAIAEQAVAKGEGSIEPTAMSMGVLSKIPGLILALAGLATGLRGLKGSKSLAVLGIVLSIVLIVLSFSPIWWNVAHS